jgi:hypothetical protein
MPVVLSGMHGNGAIALPQAWGKKVVPHRFQEEWVRPGECRGARAHKECRTPVYRQKTDDGRSWKRSN